MGKESAGPQVAVLLLHHEVGREVNAGGRAGKPSARRVQKLFCRAGGAIKEPEIPVLVLKSILYIVCGATQQQGSHI